MSEERIPKLKSCFEKWGMLRNIEKAKELLEQDNAIKKNKNVNRGVFDGYIMEIKETLQDFINNREFLSLLQIFIECVSARKSEVN